MTILTHREFVESLSGEDHSLACLPRERFDRGKYKPGTMAGKPVPEHMIPHVLVVWVERRRDRDGPYDALFSIPKPPCNASPSKNSSAS